jgi:hypothetical protein
MPLRLLAGGFIATATTLCIITLASCLLWLKDRFREADLEGDRSRGGAPGRYPDLERAAHATLTTRTSSWSA